MNPEIAVIGSVILSQGKALDQITISPDQFNEPKLARVFQEMRSMRQKHEPIDVITLGAKIPEHSVDFFEWQSAVPAWENVTYYAGMVKEAAARRELSFAAQRIQSKLNEDQDVSAILDQARRELGAIAESQTDGRIEYISHLALDHLDQLSQPRTYLPSPWPALNTAISGFRAGAMYVIGARPGVGKTVVGLQLAYELSKSGPVSFHSLEMSKSELMNRLYSQAGSVYLGNIEKGRIRDHEWENLAKAREELQKSNLAIIDKGGQTMTDIRAHARTLQQNGGLKAIVVDYLGLIRDTIPGRKRYEAITDFSVQLKTLAREFEVPVIALAQLNRQSESRLDKAPQLSDLRDSGAIEQDADVVILLRRERTEKDREWEASRMIMDVAKNRHGATGEVHLVFNGGCARVENAG